MLWEGLIVFQYNKKSCTLSSCLSLCPPTPRRGSSGDISVIPKVCLQPWLLSAPDGGEFAGDCDAWVMSCRGPERTQSSLPSRASRSARRNHHRGLRPARTWRASPSRLRCTSPDRPPGPRVTTRARMRTLARTKWCCASAGWPLRRSSAGGVRAPAYRWRWAPSSRWFRRSGPVSLGPARAASPSASLPWRPKCLAPRTGRSLHTWAVAQWRQRVLTFWTFLFTLKVLNLEWRFHDS